MKKLSWIGALVLLVAWAVYRAIDWYNAMDADMGNQKPLSSVDRMGITSSDPNQVAAGGKAKSGGGGTTPAPAPVVTPATFVPGTYICAQDIPAYDVAKPTVRIGTFQAHTSLSLDALDPITHMIKVSFRDKNGQVIRALCNPKDVGR